MDYVAAAKEILSYIGGFENILSISHCSTRLRFRLVDESKINDEQMKNITGVHGIIRRGSQYQVVIGPEVIKVYDLLKKNIINDNYQGRDNISESGNKSGREDSSVSESILEWNNIQNRESIQEKKSIISISVDSPISGIVKPLSVVNDPAFASEVLGKGIAILPEDGKVYAPFDGTVITIFSTLHAICLLSDQGMEILIHIGLNTVRLNGQYFTAYVKTSDKVKKGELMLEFDLYRIKEIGYDTVIPIIITNSDYYKEMNLFINQKVSKGDKIMEMIDDNRTGN
ncbi:glucose PTS transporter subunit IIA [Anaerocolumna aminovalerica]|uniref:glucose PTS transporter subunit IIA n=1 Tax=Anaerocolumna aminovalerica TaxID=1527 RepID=UPI001C0EC3B7|nr:glucose PTS transporter subunit IIA [Anaerocolumna aminovalerica]MBU5334730.1 glucose PTS transporter subunit IIA [Anaerocolumna aminovalerica]